MSSTCHRWTKSLPATTLTCSKLHYIRKCKAVKLELRLGSVINWNSRIFTICYCILVWLHHGKKTDMACTREQRQISVMEVHRTASSEINIKIHYYYYYCNKSYSNKHLYVGGKNVATIDIKNYNLVFRSYTELPTRYSSIYKNAASTRKHTRYVLYECMYVCVCVCVCVCVLPWRL